jgi:GH24 family phage-related lysozyme (muramidase)
MNLDRIYRRLERFEGRIRYLYLCSSGHVTIGVGHTLPDVKEALQLPFRTDGEGIAMPGQIRTGYDAVRCAKLDMRPEYYRGFTQLELMNDAITGLLVSDVNGVLRQVRRCLANFDVLPSGAQEAVVDMGFNLGVGRLMKEYPRMLAAIAAGDWIGAAAEAHRRSISEVRNRETVALFARSALHE